MCFEVHLSHRIPIDNAKPSTGPGLVEQLEQQAQKQNEDHDNIFSDRLPSTSMLTSASIPSPTKDSRESSQDVDCDMINGTDAEDGEQEEQDEQEEEESDDVRRIFVTCNCFSIHESAVWLGH